MYLYAYIYIYSYIGTRNVYVTYTAAPRPRLTPDDDDDEDDDDEHHGGAVQPPIQRTQGFYTTFGHPPHSDIYIYIYIGGLGEAFSAEPNRVIVSFRSCVRACERATSHTDTSWPKQTKSEGGAIYLLSF